MAEMKLYAASSQVGHGVNEDSLRRALEAKPDIVVCQGTSTDAGPYYLGMGKTVYPLETLRRGLEFIITAARSEGIPFICSVGGTGADVHLEFGLACIDGICRKHGWRW